MKNLQLITIAIFLFYAGTMYAQVTPNENNGKQPTWGLIGYPNVRYYFLPDVEAYYDVNSSMFIYSVRGKWMSNAELPKKYKGYDLYNAYKVALTDYQGEAPYTYFNDHKVKYDKFYHGKIQKNAIASVKIGTQPSWGLMGHPEVRYYFLPDLKVYYDIKTSMYIYNVGTGWIYSAELPRKFRGYDLFSGYKVAILDYKGDTPYVYFNDHMGKYSRNNINKELKTMSKSSTKQNYVKQDNGDNKQLTINN